MACLSLFRTSRRFLKFSASSSPALSPSYLFANSSLSSPIYYSRTSLISTSWPGLIFSRENSIQDFKFGLIHGLSTSSNVNESSKNDRNSHSSVNNAEVKAEMSWIHLYLPEKIHPYANLARLDKPIGTWLLAWPCMWSITLASSPGHLPDFKMLTLFGCGAVLLRGAGCTINDLLDRDIDTKVERTKLRPVASGQLTPFQALRFGDSTKEWITGFGIASVGSLALTGYNADIGWPFYALLAAASGQLAWQILTVDLSCRADCNRKFISNKWYGALVFCGILLGRLSS